VEVLDGAGHIPHITHTEAWTARLVAFHRQQVGEVSGPTPSR
jgi:hypothetical protein